MMYIHLLSGFKVWLLQLFNLNTDMMRRLLILLLFIGLIWACKDTKKPQSDLVALPDTAAEDDTAGTHPGKKLMETQCYVCHSPDAPEDEGRIAPPMIAIKAHYLREETTKEEFIADLWEFVRQPGEEKARMRGAVRRFGVMPYQAYKKEDIEKIGEYLFDYRIEEPEWFKEHWMQGHGKGHGKGKSKGHQRKPYINRGKVAGAQSAESLSEIGLNYAMETKKLLGQNLMGTLQKEGTQAALKFCNVQAYPLTDSISRKYKAVIKRVSDRPRNPDNRANEDELKQIAHFEELQAEGQEMEPVVAAEDGYRKFYYPIMTNSMCLQCHGAPDSDISSETLASLLELYPGDRATGYEVNQIRGIWSITFKEDKK